MNKPIKYHGGKHYLAKRINAMMPPHTHYCEPYCGGCSVLLEHEPEGHSEVINDIDSDLVNFWEVVKDRRTFEQLRFAVSMTPFSELSFNSAYERLVNREHRLTGLPEHNVTAAVDFFIVARMSRAGQQRDFATLSRTRTRRGMNEQAASWLTAIEGLPEVHARLQRVVITCRDAIGFIKQQDGPDTLFYCDPPYLPATRTARAVYRHEMSPEQHLELLEALQGIKGKFILSGYRSNLYDDWATERGIGRVDFELPNHAAGGQTKRRMTECCWVNFPVIFQE